MGEFISIGDGLIVTLFSISMVFVVLIIISVFISLLKNLNGKEKVEVAKDTKITTKSNENQVGIEEDDTINDEELVAVISAAIAASLDVSLPEINIKKINRISGSSPAWSTAGIQEQLSSKL